MALLDHGAKGLPDTLISFYFYKTSIVTELPSGRRPSSP